jgi:nucleotide-binding universal stress UspA family protein
MFKHLLVPLDGSSLAEVALPYAAFIATAFGSTVMLIHVIERNPPQKVHGVSHLTNADNARQYLEEVAQRAFPPHVKVQTHVHTSEVSEVARSIVEHAGEFSPDLIVMCTHGGGDIKDWLFGNIAQQVISLGTTAVLLIPPGANPDGAFLARRLLAPLDGDITHEQGIQVAVEFAQRCAASLHLLMVVHTPGSLTGQRAAASRMLPGATAELLNLTEQASQDYLRGHVARLKPTELAISAEVARGDPAKTIVNTAQRIGADLIVLGTHGKSGMDAFWQGSVAPKVSSQSRIPILLVRVHEQ